MIRILLLTCGTNANYHIAKTLKQQFGNDFYLIGTDINKRWEIPTIPYLDVFYQAPLTTDDCYYNFILDVCIIEKVNYLLPSFDVDQQLFFDGNTDLEGIGVKSLGINKGIRDVYRNKESMNLFLLEHGLPVPKTFMPKDLEDETMYFVKPTNGVGSVGAKMIKGREISNSLDEGIIIEELCSGPEVTLECFLYKGKVNSVARQRLAQKSGVCTKTKVYDDRMLSEVAQRFSDSAPLPYIFNLQFMQNSKGEHVITDVNLRSAGGMSLSYAAGWDEVSALANVLLQRNDAEVTKYVQPIPKEKYVMRAYTDIVTKTVNHKIAFDLDGTLLDSRKRHEAVMKDVLSSFGIDIKVDGLVAYKAKGYNNIAWLKNQGIGDAMAKVIQSKWIEDIEKPLYLEIDKLYEYTLLILKELSVENELYLLTARNNSGAAKEQIRELGLSEFFSEIEIVPSNKCTPQIKADFLRNKGIDIMIGDTESDMKAAELAGCKFLVVTQGFRSDDFWSQYDVEYFNF